MDTLYHIVELRLLVGKSLTLTQCLTGGTIIPVAYTRRLKVEKFQLIRADVEVFALGEGSGYLLYK